MNINPGFLPRAFVECLSISHKALNNLMAVQMETSALLNLARTRNGERFLTSEAEWALLLDSDMTWMPESIIRLMRTAKEKKAQVVSGLTFMENKGRIIPHAYALIPQEGGDGKPVLSPYAVLPSISEPFKVEACGGACLLVHRDAYRAVYEMTKGSTSYYWQEEEFSPRNHKMKGEDIVFSERLRAAGFDIWYEPRAIFPHTKKPDLIGMEEYVEFLDRYHIEHPYDQFRRK